MPRPLCVSLPFTGGNSACIIYLLSLRNLWILPIDILAKREYDIAKTQERRIQLANFYKFRR